MCNHDSAAGAVVTRSFGSQRALTGHRLCPCSQRPGCFQRRFPPVPQSWSRFFIIGFTKVTPNAVVGSEVRCMTVSATQR